MSKLSLSFAKSFVICLARYKSRRLEWCEWQERESVAAVHQRLKDQGKSSYSSLCSTFCLIYFQRGARQRCYTERCHPLRSQPLWKLIELRCKFVQLFWFWTQKTSTAERHVAGISFAATTLLSRKSLPFMFKNSQTEFAILRMSSLI